MIPIHITGKAVLSWVLTDSCRDMARFCADVFGCEYRNLEILRVRNRLDEECGR